MQDVGMMQKKESEKLSGAALGSPLRLAELSGQAEEPSAKLGAVYGVCLPWRITLSTQQ